MKPMPKKIKISDWDSAFNRGEVSGANWMHDQFTKYLDERLEGLEEVIVNNCSAFTSTIDSKDIGCYNKPKDLAQAIRKHIRGAK